MKAKILLTGLVAPLMFAACTQEEAFVPQQEAGKIDLSNRPTLGKVTLGFGSQTRATLDIDEGYFNSLEWTAGDAIGARIIDKPKEGLATPFSNSFLNYDYNLSYASTNYKYEKGTGAEWTTDALMVEGNYMFYAPYDGTALYRDPLKMVFPIDQEIDPTAPQAAKADANTDAIDKFFRGNNTYVVGYKFLAAEGQEGMISPTMTHIYAYPQITLKNDYTELEGEKYVAKDITIEKIVFEDAANTSYQINQKGLVEALKDAYPEMAEVKDGTTVIKQKSGKQTAGTWTTNVSVLKNAQTSQIAGPKGENSDVTVTFKPALTIKGGEEFKFHLVLPAAKYSTLTAKVYLEGDKSFVTGTTMNSFTAAAPVLTYAPGKRYAKEEYDFTTVDGVEKYEIKGTAGELATFSLKGTIGSYVEIPDIQNAADFEKFLLNVNDNTAKLYEINSIAEITEALRKQYDYFFVLEKDKYGIPYMEVDDSVVMYRNKYLSAGKITFNSKMDVEENITLDNNYIFNSDLNQKSGTLTLKGVTIEGNADFQGTKAVLDGTTKITETAKFKTVDINNAEITGAVTFNGNALIKTLAKADKATVNSGTVTIDKDSNAGLVFTLNGGELVVNKKDYAKAITVGTLKADNVTAANTAELVLNAENSFANITLNAGSIEVNANAAGFGNTFSMNRWKNGTITNNATIQIPSNAVIGKTCTFVNNGTVTGEPLDNNGTVTNKEGKTLNIKTNEGSIVVERESSTYVKEGSSTGTINNDAKAALFLDAAVKNIVYYTFTEEASTEDIVALNTKMYKINKVVFNKGINFNENIDPSKLSNTLYGVDIMDINGGYVKIKEGVSIPVGANILNISGSVVIDGFSKDYSNIILTRPAPNGTVVNIAKKSYLTIKEASFGRLSTAGTVTFNIDESLDTGDEADKKSYIALDNAGIYFSTMPTFKTETGTNVKDTSKSWNGSKWN